jgi:hypothetical protein
VRGHAFAVAVAMTATLGLVAQASAAVDAPGLYEGPTVVSEGLLCERPRRHTPACAG